MYHQRCCLLWLQLEDTTKVVILGCTHPMVESLLLKFT
nr:MAG TPA: aspartate racemase [Crassvirales sp.]